MLKKNCPFLGSFARRDVMHDHTLLGQLAEEFTRRLPEATPPDIADVPLRAAGLQHSGPVIT